MRKNKKAILSLALAASLFLSGATSHAAFSAGQKITKFKYKGFKSIKKVVKQYHGNLQMYYDNDSGTFHTIITLKQ